MPLALPGAGRIVERADLALPDTGGDIRIGQHQFGRLHPFVEALVKQGMEQVRDAGGTTTIGEHAGDRACQSNALVRAPQQQHGGVAVEVAAVERGRDHSASDFANCDQFILNSAVWRV